MSIGRPANPAGRDAVVAEDVVVIAPDGTPVSSDRLAWKQAMSDEPFSDERIEIDASLSCARQAFSSSRLESPPCGTW
jgi:hypothetical protein